MSLLSDTVSTVIDAAQVHVQNLVPLRLPGTLSVAKAFFTAGAGVGLENQVVQVPLTAPIPALSLIVKVIIDTSDPFTSSPGVASLGIGFNEPNDYLNIPIDNVPWGYLYNPVGYTDPMTAETTLNSVQFLATNASLTGGKTTVFVLFM